MTFLQLRAPTVCFWASKSCSSCLELYEHNLHLARGRGTGDGGRLGGVEELLQLMLTPDFF